MSKTIRLREKKEKRVAIQISEIIYQDGKRKKKPHSHFTVYGTTGSEAEKILRDALRAAGQGEQTSGKAA